MATPKIFFVNIFHKNSIAVCEYHMHVISELHTDFLCFFAATILFIIKKTNIQRTEDRRKKQTCQNKNI